MTDIASSDPAIRDAAIYKFNIRSLDPIVFQNALKQGLVSKLASILQLPREKQSLCLLLNSMRIFQRVASKYSLRYCVKSKTH